MEASDKSRLTTLLNLAHGLFRERAPLDQLDPFCHSLRALFNVECVAIGITNIDGQPWEKWTSTKTDPTLKELSHELWKRLQSHGSSLRWPDQNCLAFSIQTPTRCHGAIFLFGKSFPAEDEQIATVLAGQLALAHENAERGKTIEGHAAEWDTAVAQQQLLIRQIRTGRERLQALSRRLLQTQEVERRHIAHELHDEIGQSLTALKINLQSLQRASSAPQLEDSLAIVDRLLQQVRDLSLDLRPSLLDDLGLTPALRWYLDRQAQRSGIAVQLTTTPATIGVPADTATACFRIVQEAITNVLRHAKAGDVRVDVQQTESELCLTIRDDGTGFDIQAAQAKAAQGVSMGLLGMQERVLLIGGQIDMTSAPQEGTTIRVRLPLLAAAPLERRSRQRDPG